MLPKGDEHANRALTHTPAKDHGLIEHLNGEFSFRFGA
jgi:hypothetical protein